MTTLPTHRQTLMAAAVMVALGLAPGMVLGQSHSGHHGGHHSVSSGHHGGHHGVDHHDYRGHHAPSHHYNNYSHHEYSRHSDSHHGYFYYHHEPHHVYARPHQGLHLHVSYTRCASCGVSYRVGTTHVCDHVVTYPVEYIRCDDCGASYRSTVAHACDRPITYIRCGHCKVSYRSGASHVCPTTITPPAPSVRSETTVPASLPPLEGWAMLSKDNFADALGNFDAAIRDEPGRAEAHAGRALTLAMLGKDAEAVSAMRKAVDMDPGSLKNFPDGATKNVTGHLTDVYRKQADKADNPADLWFMVAALEVIRGNSSAASSALENAGQAGDRSTSTAALRDLIRVK